MYCIYLHQNQINGKCYVGQTKQELRKRWQNGLGYKDCQYFARAIMKYGWSNFNHIILEENLSEDEVNEREQYWIAYYNCVAPNGYNLTTGGSNHYQMSEIEKAKRSERAKELWKDEEYRETIINTIKQNWQRPEFREKCLKNLDRTGKGSDAKKKKVRCIETNEIFSSVREAARHIGIDHSGISLCCNGKNKTAGGYHWEFVT